MSHDSVAPRAIQDLCGGLAEPARLLDWTEADWDRLLPLARAKRVFSRLAALALSDGPSTRLPPQVLGQMAAVQRATAHRQRKILWEINRLELALRAIRMPVVVLKGAGYVMAGLRAGRGRRFGDVDLLVPRSGLAEVEAALLKAGWRAPRLDAYDERYYRDWMHEIPPLRHPDRLIEVDIHHALTPPTGLFKVDAVPLVQAAVPVEGYRFRVPAPADMVLHSAVHLFYGGEFEQGLRDLSDLDLLLREFSARDPAFWETLAARAEALRLIRPLFYALRYTERWLGTPVPASLQPRLRAFGPGPVATAAMDALLERVLTGVGATPLAHGLLWVRSHVLKMPPGLLLYHAWRKLGKGRPHRDGEP
jgi:hypothetical protein